MKKTKLNLRRLNFIKGLLVFLLVEIVIVFVFSMAPTNSNPIDSEQLKESTVTVEEIRYKYQFMNRRMFSFFSNSCEYSFPKFPIIHTNEYSMHELYETIQAGDELTIKFIQKENSNLIVEAELGNEKIRSLEAYNNFIKAQKRNAYITFVVVEVVYIAVLVFFVLFSWNGLKIFSASKSKKYISKKAE